MNWRFDRNEIFTVCIGFSIRDLSFRFRYSSFYFESKSCTAHSHSSSFLASHYTIRRHYYFESILWRNRSWACGYSLSFCYLFARVRVGRFSLIYPQNSFSDVACTKSSFLEAVFDCYFHRNLSFSDLPSSCFQDFYSYFENGKIWFRYLKVSLIEFLCFDFYFSAIWVLWFVWLNLTFFYLVIKMKLKFNF